VGVAATPERFVLERKREGVAHLGELRQQVLHAAPDQCRRHRIHASDIARPPEGQLELTPLNMRWQMLELLRIVHDCSKQPSCTSILQRGKDLRGARKALLLVAIAANV
jgi:hypothetical protein